MTTAEVLRSIATRYPSRLAAGQLADVDRIAFHIDLVKERMGTGVTVCDLGGGIGMFSVGCAAVGMKAVLVDDFQDPVNIELGESVLDIHKSYGVEVMSRNVIADGLDLADGTIDVMTTFESMEHWHHSPKRLFRTVTRVLRPAGLFVLSAPNCVSLRRRVSVPLGRGKWSQMRDWYEPDVFRGHTREPDVADLRYIANDMGLERIEVLGRNWAGHSNPSHAVRVVTGLIDGVLRARPSLCSDLYMLGYTPRQAAPITA